MAARRYNYTITVNHGLVTAVGYDFITLDDITAVGGGTVTSVNLTAPAAGITVSGGPITSSGSITLALADDLAALEALTGTNTIYYRNGASSWAAVTIGSGLSFTSGTLSATGGGGGGGSVTDGDYGDIVVSSSGAVWTIDDGAVTPAKMDDGTAYSVLGVTGTPAGPRADIPVIDDTKAQALVYETTGGGVMFRPCGTGFGVLYADGGDTFFAPLPLGNTDYTVGELPISRGGTGASTAGAARTALSLVVGTNVQAWDADLDALAALSGTNTIYYRSASNTWTAVTIGSGLSFTSGTLSATGGSGLPSQAGHNGHYLGTDGTSESWSVVNNVYGTVRCTSGVDLDGSGGFYLRLACNDGTLGTNRTLSISTQNAARSLVLTGDTSLSGTNTGDQTITLTGNVTGSGTGSFATTIAAGAVNLTTMVAGALPIVNGGTGATSASAARTNLGLGTSAVIDTGTSGTKVALTDGANQWSAAQRFINSSGITILDTNASHTLGVIVGSDLSANRTLTITPGDADRTLTLSANATLSGTNTGDQTITLTGNVTGSGTGSFATTIATNVVANTMIRQSVGLSVVGRSANSTGNVADITGTSNQVLRVSGTTLGFGAIDLSSASAATGVLQSASMPALSGAISNTSGSTTTVFGSIAGLSVLANSMSLTSSPTAVSGTTDQVLRVDNTGGTLGFGTVNTGGLGANVVTDAKLRQSAALSLIGRSANSIGNVADITAASDGQVMRRSGTAVGFGAVDLTSANAITGLMPAGNGGVPTGAMLPYAGSSAPTGYLICDGTAVSRTTYAALFAITSTTYGAGNGSTTFNLPDMRRRVPMGVGGTSVSGPANTLGATGGAETHTLTTGEMPAHTHDINFVATSGLAAGANFNLSATAGAATTSTGGGAAHNNVQPSIVVNYIIKT